MTVNCAYCGKAFTSYVSWSKRRRGRFCSRPCHYKSRTRAAADRFWRFVQKTDTCWIWAGFVSPHGYGSFNGGRSNHHVRAHRFAYALIHGPIQVGLRVCHSCDNKKCVRPDHLFLGTDKENMQDASTKGRMARGEKHWNTRLVADEVRAIRRAREEHVPIRRLAAQYKTTPTTIIRIAKRQTWRHII